MPRVIIAHHALKFGKFADHPGGEIGFREQPGARGLLWIGADEGRDIPSQAREALRALILRAELGVKGDGFQRFHPALQPHPPVEIIKMPRIRKPRAQHPFIAGDDRSTLIVRRDIGDESEMRRRRAVRIAQREIALIDAHRDLADLGRKVHERSIDRPEEGDRPFDEAGHFLEQTFIGDDAQTLRLRDFPDTVFDQAAALGGIGDDEAFPQRILPRLGAVDGESARRHEAMPLGLVARDQPMPVILALAEVERHHLAIEQSDDPPQGPHPGELALAAPAHRFRPRKAPEQTGHRPGDHFGGGLAGNGPAQHPIITLGHEFFAHRAVLAKKAPERSLRRAQTRPTLGALARRDLAPDLDRERDPPRPPEQRWNPRHQRRQCLGDQARESLGAPLLQPRRDFLGEEFQKKRRHYAPSPASHASAQRLASARTRPI